MLRKLQSKLRPYITEIIITTGTTYLLVGLYFQVFAANFLNKYPKAYEALNPYWIFGILMRDGTRGFLHQLAEPFFFDVFKLFLVRSVMNPLPQLIFFLILPLLTLFLLGEDPEEYGFRLGNWKAGFLYTTLSLLVMAPLLYWASTMPDFVRFYIRANQGSLWGLTLKYGLYMLAWEFLLRGYIYFGLEKRIGTLAVWIQSVPFAIAHLGKPPAETLTTYFGGLFLGWLSLKTRSFLYAFLIHWGIYMMLAVFIFSKTGK